MNKKLLENAISAIMSGEHELAEKYLSKYSSKQIANIYSSLSSKKDILDESWLSSLYEDDDETEISFDETDETEDELVDLVGDETEEKSDEDETEGSDEETDKDESDEANLDDFLSALTDLIDEYKGGDETEDENVKESDEDFVGRIDHSESCEEEIEEIDEIDDEMLESLAESVMSELTKVSVNNKPAKSNPSPIVQRGIKDRVGGNPIRSEKGSDGKRPNPRMERVTARNSLRKGNENLSTVKTSNVEGKTVTGSIPVGGKSLIAGKK